MGPPLRIDFFHCCWRVFGPLALNEQNKNRMDGPHGTSKGGWYWLGQVHIWEVLKYS